MFLSFFLFCIIHWHQPGTLKQSAWSEIEVTFSLTCKWKQCWSCGVGPMVCPIVTAANIVGHQSSKTKNGAYKS